MLLEDLFNISSAKVTGIVEGLKQTADQFGLPFGTRTRTYNSRRAQELGLWAEDLHRGEQFHMAAFTAYFVHGRNLADSSVLMGLAEQSGLPTGEAEKIIATRSYSTNVDRHWQQARELGVTAVPTFIAGLNRVVGAQQYKALADLVRAAGAVPKEDG